MKEGKSQGRIVRCLLSASLVLGLSTPVWAVDHDVKANLVGPVVPEGTTTLLSEDLNSNLRVVTKPQAGADVTNDVTKVEQRFVFTNITLAAPTTTVIKTGAGLLHTVTINSATALGVIQCFDNTAASGTSILTITQPAALLASQVDLLYDVAFATGLTCLTSTAAQNVTVSSR